MKKFSFLLRHLWVAGLLLALTLLPRGAAAQGWRWSTHPFGALARASVNCIAADSLGNQYIGGQFHDTVTFGAVTLISKGISDGYVAKLDSNGARVWVRQLSSTSWREYVSTGGSQMSDADNVNNVRVDERHGALLVTGATGDSATLSGFSVASGFAVGDTAYEFVARLGLLTGAPQWAQRVSGAVDAQADAAGNIITYGKPYTAMLGPYSVPQDTFFLGQVYSTKVCLASLSAAGTWQWAEFLGTNANFFPDHLVVSPGGVMWVSGSFFDTGLSQDPTRIGPYSLWPHIPTIAFKTAFLARLSPTRTVEWAKAINSGGQTSDPAVLGLEADRHGNIQMVGNADDADQIWYDTISIVKAGNPFWGHVSWVASVKPDGQLRWSAQYGTRGDSTSSYILCMSLDQVGRIILQGAATDDTLRLGNIHQVFPANPWREIEYVAALDTAGHWIWADTITFGSSFPRSSLDRHRHLTSCFDDIVVQRGLPGFIDAFSPANGPAGTVITLSGTGFLGTTGVSIGGVPAIFTVLGNGQIQVTVPPGLPTGGAGLVIQLTGPNGTSIAGDLFRRGPSGVATAGAVFSFGLYPNPARGAVRLVGLPTGAPPARVLDGVGRVVRTQAAANAELDLRGLPAGVYTVRVGAAVRRLVVE